MRRRAGLWGVTVARRDLVLAALGLVLTLAPVGATAQELPPGTVVERDVPAPMRDGVVLRADVYRPPGHGPFPALLMRTPYDKRAPLQSAQAAMTAAAVGRGYVVVVQDTRGQYASDGIFEAYTQERRDGYDTIEWVAALPYVNGTVGTFGLSYPGAAQWMTAPTAPPSLVAMSPSMTFAHPNHFVYFGGAFDADFIPWLLGRQSRQRRARDLPFLTEEAVDSAWARDGDGWRQWVPLRDLPVMEGFDTWRTWVTTPIQDPYWSPWNMEAQHHRVRVPVFNLTGWNDDAYGQPGAIRNFVGMRINGATEAARRGQRLVIGPWRHGVPWPDRRVNNGIDYGPEAVAFDYVQEQLRFFDYWMKGVDDGYSDEAPVRIFVMGDNTWRDEWEWPLARTVYTDLFLRSDGRLAADAPAPGEGSSSFRYDPRDPPELPPPGVEADGDGTVLTFTSAPLPRDTEITGHIVAHVWASSTVPDTDVTVRVFDVAPDGTRTRLSAAPGRLRVRYRSTETPRPPRPLPPGEPVELEISLGYTSYVVPAGHRLRVFVTGSLADLHPNTWEAFESWSQVREATTSVHHEAGRASRIVLPVIPR